MIDTDRANYKVTDSISHLTYYQQVVVVLKETIRLMGEIDEIIEAHGGWPIA